MESPSAPARRALPKSAVPSGEPFAGSNKVPARSQQLFLLPDTLHGVPYTERFEREFSRELAEGGFSGVLMLDDIHLNREMLDWWVELTTGAAAWGADYLSYNVGRSLCAFVPSILPTN